MEGLEGHLAKARKEAFVAGHAGTTQLDVGLTVFSTVLAPVILLRLADRARARTRTAMPPPRLPVALELLLVVTPIVAFPLSLPCGAAVCAGLVVLCARDFDRGWPPASTAQGAAPAAESGSRTGQQSGRLLPFITAYRGTMLLLTCFAILAVDFPVFPRRHAKTELVGVSLMDVGVGSMVVSAGFVAGRPSKLSALAPAGQHQHRHRHLSDSPGLGGGGSGSGMVQVPVLLVLGAARLLTVKATNYAEHISEYGVHWNFFWTVAAMATAHAATVSAAAAAGHRLGWASLLVAALGMAALHQAGLELGGLRRFVEESPRVGFVSANKEGIVSIPGYYSLFLLGAATGNAVFTGSDRLQWTFLSGCGAAAALVFGWVGESDPPSRRMVNLSYMAWVWGGNLAVIAAFKLTDRVLPAPARAPGASGSMVTAVSGNQLPVFLAANLMTGATNLTLDTLAVPDWLAVVWLVGYMSTVCLLARTLHDRDLTLRTALLRLSGGRCVGHIKLKS